MKEEMIEFRYKKRLIFFGTEFKCKSSISKSLNSEENLVLLFANCPGCVSRLSPQLDMFTARLQSRLFLRNWSEPLLSCSRTQSQLASWSALLGLYSVPRSSDIRGGPSRCQGVN
jgi:hypothetical protein